MANTEFCCRSGGSNLNAGTRTGNSNVPGTSADFTYASGSWAQSTRVFTVASGNPSTDGVAVGDFVSVYPNGSTVTPYVARVSAVSSTTITTDGTAKAGTAPVDGTSNRTVKVGGAWKGPNAADGFPFSTVTSSLTNSSGDLPRVNFSNEASYLPTSSVTHNGNGVSFEGFATSYGDKGVAKIDGGSASSFTLLTVSSSNNSFKYFEFTNNAASGSSGLVNSTSYFMTFANCIFHDCRGYALRLAQFSSLAIECEAYNFNKNNTSSQGGFQHAAGYGNTFINCIAHHGAGLGFSAAANINPCHFINCIASDITAGASQGYGFYANESGTIWQNCDAYNCVSHGFYVNQDAGHNGLTSIINCNAVKNGGWGVFLTGAGLKKVIFRNCGFGSGAAANTSGTYSGNDQESIDMVFYAAGLTPWSDPAQGNFKVTLDAAKNVGRCSFTITDTGHWSSSTSGTVDIGSAPALFDGGIVPSQVQVS